MRKWKGGDGCEVWEGGDAGAAYDGYADGSCGRERSELAQVAH